MVRRDSEHRREGLLGIGPERWKRLRALVIATLAAFNILGAYPTPGELTEEKLQEGTAKEELGRWVRRLRALGVDTDATRLGRWYAGVATSVSRAKTWLMTPITPLVDFTGTQQGWRLFALPNERPHVLRVVGERRGKRRVLYETADPKHRFLAELLEFRRVRALYNPGSSGPPDTYAGFARRLSERVFDEKQGFDTVVVSLVQLHTTLPGEPEDPMHEERFLLSFPRASR